MSDVAIAVTVLTPDTVSADVIVTAEGGTNVPSGDEAVIAAKGDTRNLVISFYAASAATALIQKGDNPPAAQQDLGDKAAQTLPAGDVLLMAVNGGRYCQDDGTIRITIGANDVVVGAHRLPALI